MFANSCVVNTDTEQVGLKPILKTQTLNKLDSNPY